MPLVSCRKAAPAWAEYNSSNAFADSCHSFSAFAHSAMSLGPLPKRGTSCCSSCPLIISRIFSEHARTLWARFSSPRLREISSEHLLCSACAPRVFELFRSMTYGV
jgi:hypothetical protein